MWGVASSPPPPAPYAPAPADAMSLETSMGSTMDSSSLLYLGVCLALLSSVSQIGKGLQARRYGLRRVYANGMCMARATCREHAACILRVCTPHTFAAYPCS